MIAIISINLIVFIISFFLCRRGIVKSCFVESVSFGLFLGFVVLFLTLKMNESGLRASSADLQSEMNTIQCDIPFHCFVSDQAKKEIMFDIEKNDKKIEKIRKVVYWPF